jgi:hypothetical protein
VLTMAVVGRRRRSVALFAPPVAATAPISIAA